MGRSYIYTIEIPESAETAAYDIVELSCTRPFELVSARWTQTSDAGDAESEQLTMKLQRATGHTSGSGGAAGTVNPLWTNYPDSGLTALVNNSTQATAGGGSVTDLFPEAENVHNGWFHAPPPPERYGFLPTESLIIPVDENPGDSVTGGGWVSVRVFFDS